ncbi:cytochrome b561 and DOMON domain-containing protein At5g47530-like [Elaeis guineensis]|uniref:Cytochrome b561 and DOMON domain-containing protein n=1 Tax=Elaeis guineensis var. tenera TaxID=51953 RepID=A0A6I9QGR4_ELAGV|nr:cytochrome b561 and DOMON domain-containing protein At5g47530-like [Elaeis guineensis]
MAAFMRPAILLSFLFSLILPCLAQNCLSDTFSNNRLYTLCSSLGLLSATLHWTYHPSNGTADIAYVAQQESSGFVAWAINPSGSDMIGANSILAFHDSAGVVTAITYEFSNYTPSVRDSNLSFRVYSREAEYSDGKYTIYATVALPGNRTTLNTVWQAGQVSGGVPVSHALSGDNIKSMGSTDFLTGESSGSGGSSRLHRKNIHGVLDAVSWGVLMPLGAIIARYLKVFKWADPAWFYLHVACQCSAYIIGVAGWGLGLKLGSESNGITYDSHRNIGIALFCLATLQIFALLLRPNKKNKYRIYWNIYHHSVGYCVIILSIVNIFKGFDILDPAKKWKRAYIAVIATLGGIALVLEAVTWPIVLKRRSRSSEKSHHGANGANVYGGRQNQVA